MGVEAGDRRLSGERVLVFGSGKIADAVAAEVRQRGADAVVASCGEDSDAKKFIEQQENIPSEQKSLLLKAVKDADYALTIAEFKLERTEKVKRTTAILLEETIEELEQNAHKNSNNTQKNQILYSQSSLNLYYDSHWVYL